MLTKKLKKILKNVENKWGGVELVEEMIFNENICRI